MDRRRNHHRGSSLGRVPRPQKEALTPLDHETFVVKGGVYAYGSYPELDELFQQQAAELDPKKREGQLHKMQQIGARERRFTRIFGSRPSSTESVPVWPSPALA
jgi:hypothetical protein